MLQALGPGALDSMIPQLLPMLQQFVHNWAVKGEAPLFEAVSWPFRCVMSRSGTAEMGECVRYSGRDVPYVDVG